jgi:four helix bundle protein
MRDFRKLTIWQKSHQLTLAIYKVTEEFPKHEVYGLTSQIRRASASIPANIAEGSGRIGEKEFARFLQISMGSASEVAYFLILVQDLKYMDNQTFKELAGLNNEVQRMLRAFITKLRAAKS